MTGFKFSWHFTVIVDHLFGFSTCADGHIENVSKKPCILIFFYDTEDGGRKFLRNASHTPDSRTVQNITQKQGHHY
jgi:hypothetical protein